MEMERAQTEGIAREEKPYDRKLVVQAELIKQLGMASNETILEYMLTYAMPVREILDHDEEVAKLLTDFTRDDKEIAQIVEIRRAHV